MTHKKAEKKLHKLRTENESMQHSSTYSTINHLLNGGRIGFTTVNFPKGKNIQPPGDDSTSSSHYHVIELNIISNLIDRNTYQEFNSSYSDWEDRYVKDLEKSFSLELYSVYSKFPVAIEGKKLYIKDIRELVLYLKEHNVTIDLLYIDQEKELKLNHKYKDSIFSLKDETNGEDINSSHIKCISVYEANKVIYLGFETYESVILKELNKIKELQIKES